MTLTYICMCECVYIYIYICVYMLYSLHNELALLHKCTSTRASDGVHQLRWHNYVWYHLRSGQIVTTPLDSQLSTNWQQFNQVHLYLVSVTWIYMFFYQIFCVPCAFLWSLLQQYIYIYIYTHTQSYVYIYIYIYIYIHTHASMCEYIYIYMMAVLSVSSVTTSVSVCVYICIYIHIYVCIHTYIHTYLCFCVCVYIYIYIYISMIVCVCIYIHIYVCKYMYTHTTINLGLKFFLDTHKNVIVNIAKRFFSVLMYTYIYILSKKENATLYIWEYWTFSFQMILTLTFLFISHIKIFFHLQQNLLKRY